jgi:hypothetical protein
MIINNNRSVFWERQHGQSFQEPHLVVTTEPTRSYVVPAHFNPFPRFQGCLVAEAPFLRTIWLLEGNTINPSFWPVKGPSRMVMRVSLG